MTRGIVAGATILLLATTTAFAQAPGAPPTRPPTRRFAPPPQPPYTPPAPGQPVEPRPPNAVGQKPAFPEQTRAPYAPSGVKFEVTTLVSGLRYPWGVAFLPDGRMLVTERDGDIRIATKDGQLSPPLQGVPPVHQQGVSGMLDIAVDPHFRKNHLVYWAYAEPRGENASASIARGRLVVGPTPALQDVTVIYRAEPAVHDTHSSFGGRLLFAKDGTLFFTLGDRDFDQFRPLVQRMDTSLGKIVRIRTDGSAPRDNPFVGQAGARPEIWAVGFRNPNGLAYRPGTDELWGVSIGPRGGDVLQIIKRGANYGWPILSYGEEYSGKPIGEGLTVRPGFEQPVYYWDPVISPSSLTFYDGKLFPQWKGNIFVTSLTQQHLDRLVLDGDKVVGEERLLTDTPHRLREVVEAPDGSLLVLTDDADGKILQITPAA